MQNKIVHAAERKAFQTVLNGIVNKGQKRTSRKWPIPWSI